MTTTTPHLWTTIATPGAGKSTLIRECGWPQHQVVSLDDIRAELCGDAADQSRNREAVAIRDQRIRALLSSGTACMVDATNTVAWQRQNLLDIAAEFDAQSHAVVITTPLHECLKRNAARDRTVPEHVVRAKHREYASLSKNDLHDEGFNEVVFAAV